MKSINIYESVIDNLLSIEPGVLLGDYESWKSEMKYQYNYTIPHDICKTAMS